MSTQFGAMLNKDSVPDQTTLIKDHLNLDIVRTSIVVKDYDGDAENVNKFLNQGLKVALTLNWGSVGRDQQGNKIPVPFPTDLSKYKNKVRPILEKYGMNPAVLQVTCENEPTTKNFHSGPMSDYLNELKAFIDVCKEVGCNDKSTAGAVHNELVKSVMNNDMNDSTSEGKAGDVDTLLQGYTDIDFTYLNFHTSASGKSYPATQISDTTTYALNRTNKTKVLSDEWHIEAYPDISYGVENTHKICGDHKKANYFISVYISGTGDDRAGLLNDWDTYNLTPIGEAYKEEGETPAEDPNLTRLKEIWPDPGKEAVQLIKQLNPDVNPACTKTIKAGDELTGTA